MRINTLIGTNNAPTAADRLLINTDVCYRVLVDFIRDGVTKAGYQRAVLGLSGGIDSALSAFLAVEALGPENVLAVRMPYRTSSEGSLTDAQKVIDQLGIRSLTIPISPMVDPLIDQFPDM